jgi:hypothetical protein
MRWVLVSGPNTLSNLYLSRKSVELRGVCAISPEISEGGLKQQLLKSSSTSQTFIAALLMPAVSADCVSLLLNGLNRTLTLMCWFVWVLPHFLSENVCETNNCG